MNTAVPTQRDTTDGICRTLRSMMHDDGQAFMPSCPKAKKRSLGSQPPPGAGAQRAVVAPGPGGGCAVLRPAPMHSGATQSLDASGVMEARTLPRARCNARESAKCRSGKRASAGPRGRAAVMPRTTTRPGPKQPTPRAGGTDLDVLAVVDPECARWSRLIPGRRSNSSDELLRSASRVMARIRGPGLGI
jgi:hypothetical protein